MREHRLDAGPGTAVDVFDPRHAPCLRIDPGDRLRVTSLDASGHLERQRVPGERRPLLLPERRGHCLTGPVAVTGARPGDRARGLICSRTRMSSGSSKRLLLSFLACLALAPLSARGAEPSQSVELRCQDIGELMTQYLRRHVRYGEIDAPLRGFTAQTYLERVDPQRTLLLTSEMERWKSELTPAVDAIRANAPAASIGGIHNVQPTLAASDAPEDQAAARTYEALWNGAFPDPQMLGCYPAAIADEI